MSGNIDRHGGNIGGAVEEYGLSPDKIIDFSASINPLGMPPGARMAVRKNLDSIHHYPDPECKFLRNAISEYLKISPDNILTGNGSSEFLFLIARAFRPKRVLVPVPAFSEYEKAARIEGAKCVFVKAKEGQGFRLGTGNIAKNLKGVDLLFICNPNNPTGILYTRKNMKYLADTCRISNTLMIVDEVFMDYVKTPSECTMIMEAIRSSRILVLGSLTKFFAMPGLRLGYLIGTKTVLKKIRNYQTPWSVNSLAQAAGAEILRDKYFIEKSRRYMSMERLRLYRQLCEIDGITPYLPKANFIFCKIRGITSIDLCKHCGMEGILIRDCSNFRGLDNRFIRVAVMRREENAKMVNTISRIMQDFRR